mmetsp:Transcript_16493/g.30451  ORF Transcript_16493/g.30451 Transcript_16493/m.30451 type:complete len:691 (+) Transcript_16493:70-2142(+)
MEDADAMQGVDLLSMALGRLPGAADLDEFVEFEIYFDGALHAAQAGCAAPFLRARLCDAFEVFGAAGLDKYLWHRDRLVLEVSLGEEIDDEPHLVGHMRTGDGAEDEWFVVHLLKHLTMKRSDVSCRIVDSDGELLIIEAALAAPRWLTPTNAEYRCWLRSGRVHLLPRPRPPEPQQIRCPEALASLRHQTSDALAKEKVQRAILARLDGYPQRAVELSRHVARAVLPAKLARLVLAFPQLVAVALDHLPPPPTQELLRLRRALAGAEAAARFDCQDLPADEMACIGVRFTRCQYARVLGLKFQLPQRFTQRHWRQGAKSAVSGAASDDRAMRLGAMLCAGLESAFLQGPESATAALRWPSARLRGSLLPAELPWWQDASFGQEAMKLQLAMNSEYSKRAFEQQRSLDEPFRPALMRVLESQALTEVDLAAHWRDSDDPEDWLHISSEDLDAEMNRRQAEFDAFDRRRTASTANSGGGNFNRADKATDNDAQPEELRKELAAMGQEISGLLDRASCLDGVDAAPRPAASEGVTGGDSSDSADASGDEMDVLGMEDEGQAEEDSSEGEDDQGNASSAEIRQYMTELDDQLDNELDSAPEGAPGDPSSTENATPSAAGDAFPLGSHHIRVDASDPLDLDVHAMEHVLASYCSEHHLEPGPASLLLGELGVAQGRGADGPHAVPIVGGLDSMD